MCFHFIYYIILHVVFIPTLLVAILISRYTKLQISDIKSNFRRDKT